MKCIYSVQTKVASLSLFYRTCTHIMSLMGDFLLKRNHSQTMVLMSVTLEKLVKFPPKIKSVLYQSFIPVRFKSLLHICFSVEDVEGKRRSREEVVQSEKVLNAVAVFNFRSLVNLLLLRHLVPCHSQSITIQYSKSFWPRQAAP